MKDTIKSPVISPELQGRIEKATMECARKIDAELRRLVKEGADIDDFRIALDGRTLELHHNGVMVASASVRLVLPEVEP